MNYEEVIKQQSDKLDKIKHLVSEIDRTNREHITTSRNSKAVRDGFCMGGSLAHYEMMPSMFHRLQEVVDD
jgi:hypothetical protein